MDESLSGTPERPHYAMVRHGEGATQLYMVTCDEGWRSSIVCEGMYDWAATWLVGVLQWQPFAPETRPGAPGVTQQ